MRFQTVTVLSLLSAFAAATPAPAPAPEPVAAVEELSKRADNWCRVVETVHCRQGPSQDYPDSTTKPRVYPEDRFGVRCTRESQDINGDRTWDWIPGWGCWVSAYYTRTAGTQQYCESNLGTC